MSNANSKTGDTVDVSRTRIPGPRRRILAAVLILTAIGASWYYATFVYARPISRYDQLKTYVGKRVTFTTIVNSQAKAYTLVYIEGKPITFSHTPGGRDWSPKPTEGCRVVGIIQHTPNNMWGFQYRLSQAEYYPLREGSDDNSEM